MRGQQMRLSEDGPGRKNNRPGVEIRLVITPRLTPFKDLIENTAKELEYAELAARRERVDGKLRELERRKQRKCTLGDVAEFVSMEKQESDRRGACTSKIVKHSVAVAIGLFVVDKFLLPVPTFLKIASLASIVLGTLALTLNQINRNILEDESAAVEAGVKRMNLEIARLRELHHSTIKRMRELSPERTR